MRELLVIGGEGNLSGMNADRHPDDMTGLIAGLNDSSQYKQIVFYFTDQFLMPPEDVESLLPSLKARTVAEATLRDSIGDDEFESRFGEHDDNRLLEEAKALEGGFHEHILNQGTVLALGLFFETICSCTGGRQIVLILGNGNNLCSGLLPFYRATGIDELDDQQITTAKLPLLSGIKSWPITFERYGQTEPLNRFLFGRKAHMEFPWGSFVSMIKPLNRCIHALETTCQVSYPAEDALKHPRALLLECEGSGYLLAIPRPSNMKNFSITLRIGKGLNTPHLQICEDSSPNTPTVERNWMTRQEVADAIGKSKDTVDNYLRDEKLSSTKVGREVRISKESVQAYLSEN